MYSGSGTRIGLALAGGAAVVSGFSIFLNGYAAGEFASPTLLTTMKNCLVGVTLVLLMIASGRLGEIRQTGRRVRAGFLAIAIFGGSVPFVLFFEGLARVEAGNAAFLHKTLFLWVAVLAMVILRERLGPLQLAALGVLLVAHFLIGGPGALRPGDGETMVLAATLLWAGETILVKRILPEVSAGLAATARMAGGSIVLLAYVFSTGRLGMVLELSGTQLLWLAATALILLAYVTLWYGALKRASASIVTAILTVGAPITAALGVVIDGRPLPSGEQAAGYGLLILAIAFLIAAALVWEARKGADKRRLEPALQS